MAGFLIGIFILAGKHIISGKIRKIVGLDPAGPLFSYNKVDERLSENDARFVEVIHTSAGYLGFAGPLGSANFYPNGGSSQPGCERDFSGKCSHARSYHLFLESLYTDIHFYSLQCESLEEVQQGNCRIVGKVVKMGGEPGNFEK